MKHKKIQLLNGIVMVPNDFITLDTTITASVNYAGIVAEVHGLIPHFLFTSEKPINELTEEDENRIFDLCCESYPEIAEVRAKEIEAVFDDNGILINKDEWIKAPRLGIFGIMDVKGEFDLYLDTGIITRGNYGV